MKFQKLEIEGFGPFKSKQTIDFSNFAKQGQGLFLIEGKTGAGKSSILDAITYALYNFTARWESVKANDKHKSVRSRFCEPADSTKVTLEFSIDSGALERKFRIERSIPGLDRNGEEKKQKVALEELFDDSPPKGLAAQQEAVGKEVVKLLGLTGSEFLQVVLLAQGKFEAFLAADTDKRLDLLRKLFNTNRFQRLQKNVEDRAKQIKEELAIDKNALNILITGLSQSLEIASPEPDSSTEWLNSLAVKYGEALREIKEISDNAREALAKATTEVTASKTKQEFEELKARKVDLAKDRKKQDASELQLTLAAKAARVEGLYDAYLDSGAALELADRKLTEFEGTFSLPKETAKLKVLLAESTKVLAELEALIPAEIGLEGMRLQLKEREDELLSLTQTVSATEASLGLLTSERDLLKPSVADLDLKRADRDEAVSALQKFREYETIQAEIDQARADHKEKLEKAATYSDVHAKVQASYLSNQAVALASTLAEGEECPVCGSMEHPSKAKASKGHGAVTQLEFETSLEALQQFRDAETSAKAKLDEIAGNLKPLEASLDKLDRPTLSTKAEKTEADFQKALVDSTRKNEIDEQLAPDSEFMTHLGEIRQRVSHLNQDSITLRKSIGDQEKVVSNNLGGFDSIQAHYDSVESKIEEINEASQLVLDKTTANAAFDKSKSKYEAKREEEGFDSTENFTEVRLAQGEFDLLAEEVSKYKNEMNEVDSLLAQERFKSLPAKSLPLEQAEESARDADLLSVKAQGDYAIAKDQSGQISRCQATVRKLVPKISKKQSEYDTHQRLALTLNGQNPPNTMQISLETYFAAAELESILGAANGHLSTMDAGKKIELVHSDKALKRSGQTGLGVNILDKDSQTLGYTETLSGGEKFQVSLAIALGLAQVVSERSGAVRIDTLFVDEGFGTLDEDVLRLAMHTLQGLKNGGRTIGLISHVAEMKEIAAKLHVDKTPHGPSNIRQVFL
jgi:exonuclease SbcC